MGDVAGDKEEPTKLEWVHRKEEITLYFFKQYLYIVFQILNRHQLYFQIFFFICKKSLHPTQGLNPQSQD